MRIFFWPRISSVIFTLSYIPDLSGKFICSSTHSSLLHPTLRTPTVCQVTTMLALGYKQKVNNQLQKQTDEQNKQKHPMVDVGKRIILNVTSGRSAIADV